MKYCGIDLHSNNSVVVISDEEDRIVFSKRLPNDLGQIRAALEPHREELAGRGHREHVQLVLAGGRTDGCGLPGASGPPERDQEVRGPEVQRGLRRCGVSGAAAAPGIVGRGLHLSARGAWGARPGAQAHAAGALPHRADSIDREHPGAADGGAAERRGGQAADGRAGRGARLCARCGAGGGGQPRGEPNAGTTDRSAGEAAQGTGELAARVSLLKTAPGIGETLATTIMLETGTIGRFAKVGNFSSYCRCVDSLRESNGKKKGEGNTKNGNKYLAWAFVEAANFARRYCPQAKRFYERKKRKTNGVLATKALAHKLARACYHMLREQKPFDVSRCFG